MLQRTLCPKLSVFKACVTPASRSFSSSSTRYSGSPNLDSKAFAKTLQLPKTSFPLWTNAAEVEERYRQLTCDKLYQWQWENSKGPVFVLHDGPPYANGDLHMGHALNKVLKDIINRFQLLMGRKVHYVPGWDCHGLPIENKTLKELGRDVSQLSAAEIRAAAQATALREVVSQKAQFRPLGVMADWDSQERSYRTLDHAYEMRQLRIFQKMVEKGLIYRHYRPVHYSPSSLSALAEAELVYKDDHVSHSVFVTFELDPKSPMASAALLQATAENPRVKLLVWTTTPWTLTANMGIAVHSEMAYVVVKSPGEDSSVFIVAQDRLEDLADVLGPTEVLATLQGSDLVGASYIPIFASLPSAPAEPLKIIHSSHVTAETGTGLVHCAPAHGSEDYQAFQALGLISNTQNMICHVGRSGEFVNGVAEVVGAAAAERLVSKPVLKDGSKVMVDLLKDVGNLVKVKRIKHRYPYDWKTDEPIVVTATSQWFANLDNIKTDALEALEEVTFFPAISRNRLESFVRSRSEWCISRQRVWGVPIPALYEVSSDKAILDSSTLDHILSVLEAKGTSHWWSGPVEDFLPPSLLEQAKAHGLAPATTWRKGTDTMDVWFDSGTSWSMLPKMGVGRSQQQLLAGASEEGEEEECGSGIREFHADICLEGSDQHRGWFQSQLLTAVGAADPGELRPSSPYGTLITHGMVLDEKGRKMSKSLGNIVSPRTVIYGGKDKKKEPAYGADILRLWAATVEYWRDMSIGPTVLSQTAESYRKIRNSARFCLGNVDGLEGRPVVEKVPREELNLIERYVMHELYLLEQTALDGYSTYNFPKVANALTNFANITLSSLYFDITKDCLYANKLEGIERRNVVTVLNHILSSLTKIMGPILPHLAEEIHATWKNDGTSAFSSPWIPLGPEWQDNEAAQHMDWYLQLRGPVLSLLEQARGKKQIRSSLEAAVDIVVPSEANADNSNQFISLLSREGVDTLKTLFIVSDATITTTTSPGALEGTSSSSLEWIYTDTVTIPGTDVELGIRVRPATLHKCPRCWTYTREEATLCARCTDAVGVH